MLNHAVRFGLVACALQISTADAIVHGGNPHLDFYVTPPEGNLTTGTVDVGLIRVHHCGGGHSDYIVDDTIDPVAGYGLDIVGGDLCSVVVFWDSDMLLSGTNASGNYEIRYDAPSTMVILGDPSDPAKLAPFTLEAGIVHGGNPHLDVEVNR